MRKARIQNLIKTNMTGAPRRTHHRRPVWRRRRRRRKITAAASTGLDSPASLSSGITGCAW